MRNIKTFKIFEDNKLTKDEVAEYFYDFTDNRTYYEKSELTQDGENGYGTLILEIDFGEFDDDKLDILYECLSRFYDATEFRPVSNIIKNDYVDEDNGEMVSLYKVKLLFFKCSDEQYQRYIIKMNKYHKRDKTENVKLQKLFI